MELKYDEESSLLGNASAIDRAQPASSNKKILAAAVLSLTALAATVAYFRPSSSVQTSVTYQTTDLANAFSGRFYKDTGRNADGGMEFLDRHYLNCGDSPISGFRVNGKLNINYNCENLNGVSKTASYGYNTGDQEFGGVIYLDRQKAWCPWNTLMYSLKGYTNSYWYGRRFTYGFSCSPYNWANYGCSDQFTNWNDPGPSNTMIYLDRHNVNCPDGQALRGFEGQTRCEGWWCSTQFRYKYQCCRATIPDPTAFPIARPTQNPTLDPSPVPTLAPTLSPTFAPTPVPIASPTEFPVANPTEVPTFEPSAVPTPVPISDPTEAPISDPTLEPTKQPVANPTYVPTLAPVADPTFEPTLAPVAHPSQYPTLEPTGAPVVVPVPTEEPIAHPSQPPTKEPTANPIADPTHEPTLTPTPKPSFEPSQEPTFRPTDVPISKPTDAPTFEPTFEPTFKPSAVPTLEPTKEPTLSPIAQPTESPTFEPSKPPTPGPSFVPTVEPSASPISDPTFEPTVAPTKEPTHEPTLSPEIPPAPKDFSQADIKAFMAEKDAPEPVPEPPGEPVVIQAPAADNDDAPDVPPAPPAAAEIAKEAAVADAIANGKDPEAAAKAPVEPVLAPAKPEDVKTKYCPFVYTASGNAPSVPVGCALLAADNLENLSSGSTTKAAYICSIDTGAIQISSAKLDDWGLSGSISYIKPGSLTSVTWFVDGDFTGPQYTYTSGFHPKLENVHMPGSNLGNDHIKSVIVKSTATTIDVPAVC